MDPLYAALLTLAGVLVALALVLLAIGGGNLGRRIRRNFASAFENCRRFIPTCSQVRCDLLVSSCFRADRRGLSGLFRTD